MAKVGSVIGTNGHASRSSAHLEALETTDSVVANIELPKLDIRTMKLKIVGDSSLITHKWSEKAMKEILDKQMGKASEGREHKNPVRDYRESLYVIRSAPDDEPFENGVFGFPSIAFKNAAVTACTSLGKSITKVAARQAFHMVGELVEIHGRPTMREDMVRVGMGKADIRYRGEFVDWWCELVIRYNARVLSDEQIVNIVNTSGFAVGVGEWLSEKDGSHGLFHVE